MGVEDLKLAIYECYDSGDITYGEKEYLLEQVALYEASFGADWDKVKRPVSQEDRDIYTRNKHMNDQATAASKAHYQKLLASGKTKEAAEFKRLMKIK